MKKGLKTDNMVVMDILNASLGFDNLITHILRGYPLHDHKKTGGMIVDF